MFVSIAITAVLLKYYFVYCKNERTIATTSNIMPTTLIVTPQNLPFDFFSFNALTRLIIAITSKANIKT